MHSGRQWHVTQDWAGSGGAPIAYRSVSTLEEEQMRTISRYARAAMLVACLATLAACNRPPKAPVQQDARSTEEAAIRATSGRVGESGGGEGPSKRPCRTTADDASMFPPNMPIVTGPDARRRTWAALLAPPDLIFSNSATKVEAGAIRRSRLRNRHVRRIIQGCRGNPLRVTGKYVVVWKKQANGQWKAIVDIFNTDQ
jgi:ketosteroid isomerase-like protein